MAERFAHKADGLRVADGDYVPSVFVLGTGQKICSSVFEKLVSLQKGVQTCDK